jgi:hypothetical protein
MNATDDSAFQARLDAMREIVQALTPDLFQPWDEASIARIRRRIARAGKRDARRVCMARKRRRGWA